MKQQPEWEPGPSIPRTRGVVLKYVGSFALWVSGWRITGSFPDTPRFVIIVAPHTSNWDFIVGLMAKWAMRLKVRFLGKDTLFHPPLGWFMRSLGGIPVDQSQHNNLVDASVQAFVSAAAANAQLVPASRRKAHGRP